MIRFDLQSNIRECTPVVKRDPTVHTHTHTHTYIQGDRGSTVVKVQCYKSEGRWFDPSWCQWIFY